MWLGTHAYKLVVALCSAAALSSTLAQKLPAHASVDASCYERGATATVHLQEGTPNLSVKLDNLVLGFENEKEQSMQPFPQAVLTPGTTLEVTSFLRIAAPGNYKFYVTSSDPVTFELRPVTGPDAKLTSVENVSENGLNTTITEFSKMTPGLYSLRAIFQKELVEPAPALKVEWEFTELRPVSPTTPLKHIARGPIWRQQLYRNNCPNSLLTKPSIGQHHGVSGLSNAQLRAAMLMSMKRPHPPHQTASAYRPQVPHVATSRAASLGGIAHPVETNALDSSNVHPATSIPAARHQMPRKAAFPQDRSVAGVASVDAGNPFVQTTANRITSIPIEVSSSEAAANNAQLAAGDPLDIADSGGVAVATQGLLSVPVESLQTVDIPLAVMPQFPPLLPLVNDHPVPGGVVENPLGMPEHEPMPLPGATPGAYGEYGLPVGSYGLSLGSPPPLPYLPGITPEQPAGDDSSAPEAPAGYGSPATLTGSYGLTYFGLASPPPLPFLPDTIPGAGDDSSAPLTGSFGTSYFGLGTPPPLPFLPDLTPEAPAGYGSPAPLTGSYGASYLGLGSPPPLPYLPDLIPEAPAGYGSPDPVTGSYGASYLGLGSPPPLPYLPDLIPEAPAGYGSPAPLTGSYGASYLGLGSPPPLPYLPDFTPEAPAGYGSPAPLTGSYGASYLGLGSPPPLPYLPDPIPEAPAGYGSPASLTGSYGASYLGLGSPPPLPYLPDFTPEAPAGYGSPAPLTGSYGASYLGLGSPPPLPYLPDPIPEAPAGYGSPASLTGSYGASYLGLGSPPPLPYLPDFTPEAPAGYGSPAPLTGSYGASYLGLGSPPPLPYLPDLTSEAPAGYGSSAPLTGSYGTSFLGFSSPPPLPYLTPEADVGSVGPDPLTGSSGTDPFSFASPPPFPFLPDLTPETNGGYGIPGTLTGSYAGGSAGLASPPPLPFLSDALLTERLFGMDTQPPIEPVQATIPAVLYPTLPPAILGLPDLLTPGSPIMLPLNPKDVTSLPSEAVMPVPDSSLSSEIPRAHGMVLGQDADSQPVPTGSSDLPPGHGMVANQVTELQSIPRGISELPPGMLSHGMLAAHDPIPETVWPKPSEPAGNSKHAIGVPVDAGIPETASAGAALPTATLVPMPAMQMPLPQGMQQTARPEGPALLSEELLRRISAAKIAGLSGLSTQTIKQAMEAAGFGAMSEMPAVKNAMAATISPMQPIQSKLPSGGSTIAPNVPAATVVPTIPAGTIALTVPAATIAPMIPADTIAPTIPADTIAPTIPAGTGQVTGGVSPGHNGHWVGGSDEPRYVEDIGEPQQLPTTAPVDATQPTPVATGPNPGSTGGHWVGGGDEPYFVAEPQGNLLVGSLPAGLSLGSNSGQEASMYNPAHAYPPLPKIDAGIMGTIIPGNLGPKKPTLMGDAALMSQAALAEPLQGTIPVGAVSTPVAIAQPMQVAPADVSILPVEVAPVADSLAEAPAAELVIPVELAVPDLGTLPPASEPLPILEPVVPAEAGAAQASTALPLASEPMPVVEPAVPVEVVAVQDAAALPPASEPVPNLEPAVPMDVAALPEPTPLPSEPVPIAEPSVPVEAVAVQDPAALPPASEPVPGLEPAVPMDVAALAGPTPLPSEPVDVAEPAVPVEVVAVQDAAALPAASEPVLISETAVPVEVTALPEPTPLPSDPVPFAEPAVIPVEVVAVQDASALPPASESEPVLEPAVPMDVAALPEPTPLPSEPVPVAEPAVPVEVVAVQDPAALPPASEPLPIVEPVAPVELGAVQDSTAVPSVSEPVPVVEPVVPAEAGQVPDSSTLPPTDPVPVVEPVIPTEVGAVPDSNLLPPASEPIRVVVPVIPVDLAAVQDSAALPPAAEPVPVVGPEGPIEVATLPDSAALPQASDAAPVVEPVVPVEAGVVQDPAALPTAAEPVPVAEPVVPMEVATLPDSAALPQASDAAPVVEPVVPVEVGIVQDPAALPPAAEPVPVAEPVVPMEVATLPDSAAMPQSSDAAPVVEPVVPIPMEVATLPDSATLPPASDPVPVVEPVVPVEVATLPDSAVLPQASDAAPVVEPVVPVEVGAVQDSAPEPVPTVEPAVPVEVGALPDAATLPQAAEPVPVEVPIVPAEVVSAALPTATADDPLQPASNPILPIEMPVQDLPVQAGDSAGPGSAASLASEPIGLPTAVDPAVASTAAQSSEVQIVPSAIPAGEVQAVPAIEPVAKEAVAPTEVSGPAPLPGADEATLPLDMPAAQVGPDPLTSSPAVPSDAPETPQTTIADAIPSNNAAEASALGVGPVGFPARPSVQSIPIGTDPISVGAPLTSERTWDVDLPQGREPHTNPPVEAAIAADPATSTPLTNAVPVPTLVPSTVPMEIPGLAAEPDNHELQSAGSGVIGRPMTVIKPAGPGTPLPDLETSPAPAADLPSMPASINQGVVGEPWSEQQAATSVQGEQPRSNLNPQQPLPVSLRGVAEIVAPASGTQGGLSSALQAAAQSTPVEGISLSAMASMPQRRSSVLAIASQSTPVEGVTLPAVSADPQNPSVATQPTSLPSGGGILGPVFQTGNPAAQLSSSVASTSPLEPVRESRPARHAMIGTTMMSDYPAHIAAVAGSGGTVPGMEGGIEHPSTGGTELNPAYEFGDHGKAPGAYGAPGGTGSYFPVHDKPHYFDIKPADTQPINRRLLERQDRALRRHPVDAITTNPRDPMQINNFITSEHLPAVNSEAPRTRVTLITVMEHDGSQQLDNPTTIFNALADKSTTKSTVVINSKQEAPLKTTSTQQAADVAVEGTAQKPVSQLLSHGSVQDHTAQDVLPAARPWSVLSFLTGALGCNGSAPAEATPLHKCLFDVLKAWLPGQEYLSLSVAQQAPQGDAKVMEEKAARQRHIDEQVYRSLFNDPSVLSHAERWAKEREITHKDALTISHAADLAMSLPQADNTEEADPTILAEPLRSRSPRNPSSHSRSRFVL
eukprot:jgi/Botrbrau1/2993/Bobra.0026s0053.2